MLNFKQTALVNKFQDAVEDIEEKLKLPQYYYHGKPDYPHIFCRMVKTMRAIPAWKQLKKSAPDEMTFLWPEITIEQKVIDFAPQFKALFAPGHEWGLDDTDVQVATVRINSFHPLAKAQYEKDKKSGRNHSK